MSKWKRGLASLLSAVILVSLLPLSVLADWSDGTEAWQTDDMRAVSTVSDFQERDDVKAENFSDVELYSMMPLKEEHLEVDLRGYFPSELAGVTLETLLPKVRIPDGSAVVWSRLGDDKYTISNKSGTVDLSKERRDVSLEIIVGTADQLDLTNTRYLVTVHIQAPDFDGILDMDATYASEERGSIRVLNSEYRHTALDRWGSYRYSDEESEEDEEIGEYRFTVDETWRDGPAYLSMRKKNAQPEETSGDSESVIKDDFANLTVNIYEGAYLTLEEYQRSAETAVDITEKVWEVELNTERAASQYKTNLISGDEDAAPLFTAVWRRNGNAVAVMPFRITVVVTPRRDYVAFTPPETINRKNADGQEENYALVERSHVKASEEQEYETFFYQIPVAGLNSEDRYNIRATFHHFDEENGYSEPLYSEYGIKVYASDRNYASLEEALTDEMNARDVTTQIFAAGFSADFSKGIVFSVFNDKGALITCQKIQAVPEESLEFGSLYKANDRDFQPTDPYEGRGSSSERIYQMQSFSYMASDPYSIRANYIRNLVRASYQAHGIKVLAGTRSYETYAEAMSSKEKMTDVTEALLGDAGYTADFSRGIVFTAFNSDGNRIDRMRIQTENFRSPSLSDDTYFRMRSARSSGKNQYQVYAMPADADGYYLNGYQTLFLLNDDSPVTDSKIVPVFYTPDPKTVIYAGHDESGARQQSGVTAVNFVSGNPIHYSAAAENGTHLKNYWVTFLTRQQGPSLFVNVANDTEHLDRDTGLPIREVFITGQTGGYHDVFFANVGDEPLEDISVSLEKGDNIYLDSYWTIRESASSANKTLSAFTTTNSNVTDYGELPNVGKIRIYPKDIKNTGDIDDILTIRHSGGEERIKLSGKIGDIQITTPEGPIKDGVRYVVYSRLLQTNNLYGGNTVSFEITDGQLPEGYTLKPNGEIYGVTGETGEFEFTVTATFTYNGIVRSSDKKTYTLTVKDNTDENVNAETDVEDGYQVNYWIPDMIIAADVVSPSDELIRNESGAHEQVELDGYHDVYFESNGEFQYFVSLWLNGHRLTEGVDFTVKSGTTEFVASKDSMSTYGRRGNNTISVEGRPDGDNAEAKRTNLNFQITVGSGNSGNSGSSSSGNNSNTGNGSNRGNNNSGNSNSGSNRNNSSSSGNNSGNNSGNTRGSSSGSSSRTNTTSTPTAYLLHTSSASHGTIRLNRSSATRGTIVTVTLTPDPGYEVASVSAWGTNLGGDVALRGSGNTRTFTMPGKQVTVSAEFKVMRMGSITDVVGTDWYFENVKWAYDNWIMRGVTDETFVPFGPVSGISSVISLRRMDGVDLTPYYTGEDDGLDNSAWYVAAARWAKVSGLLPNGEFMGYEGVSRGYVAVMLKNYLDYRDIHVELPETPVNFADENQMSATEIEAFRILYQTGIFRGDGSGNMEPQTIATRLDLTLLLFRLNLYVNSH